MPDREKAIRILGGNYKSFVLRHKGELITVNELLALLKAQEPRVLTAENFDTQHDLDWSRGLPAWVEYRRDGEWGEYWGDTQDEWAVVRKDMLNAEGYRCWTGYPSQKQRKETPWEQNHKEGEVG